MKACVKMFIGACLVMIAMLAYSLPTYAADTNYNYYDETFRPQYHYTPPANWMNDPNGMVYYEGEYHLFYQYYPDGEVWGPMHWGHAVSTDLVNWTTLPIALYPDSLGDIFSGSAVIDWNNTAGFGEEAMVAIFTHNGAAQQQSIAYSTDKGRTWTKYAGNPVIPNPGIANFRDPKVFWHAATNKWVMTLAADDRVKIYTSPNLKNWSFANDFGVNQGSHGGVWECPDLFPLAVDGNAANVKWVMVVSIGNGSVAGGSGMQYFIGDFDGTTFTNNNPASTVLWSDYGPDYYAAVSWSDIPSTDGRRIWLGWMNNWNYATVIPASTWRSSMSVPRELKLKTYPEGIRLQQVPVAQLQSLRGAVSSWGTQTIVPGSNLLSAQSGDSFEVIAEFQADTATASEFGFKVRKGGNQFTSVSYNKTNSKLFVDRSFSGIPGFNSTFAYKHEAPLSPDANGKLRMHFFVDRQSVEALGNDGKVAISSLIFPDRSSLGMELYAVGGNVTLNSLNMYPIQKSMGATPFVSNLSGWVNVNGKWADTVGGKRGRSSGDAFTVSSQIGANFTYEADVKLLNSSQGAGALIFRANPNATQGYAANIDTMNDVVKLFKFNGDGSTTVIGQYAAPLNTSTDYHLKVVASGVNIKVYLGSTLALDVNDSTFESGYFGLNVWNSSTEFRNVNASNVTGLQSNLKAMVPANGTWSNTASGKQGSFSGNAFTLSPQTAGYVDYSANIQVTSGGAGALVFRSDATGANAYLANVDVQKQVVKLFKFVNNSATVLGQYPAALSLNTNYNLRVVADGANIKVYFNGSLVHNVTDSTFSSGRLGLNVWKGTAVFQNISYSQTTRDLTNHDFEAGNLSGWTVASGSAFNNADIASAATFWGGPFNHQGNYHLWGFNNGAGGDSAIGELRSETFTLGGNGQISFMLGGGNDNNNLYAALVDAATGTELLKTTGINWESYGIYEWDAWKYIGKSLYIKLVDQAAGGWGHLNLDDVNVPVTR